MLDKTATRLDEFVAAAARLSHALVDSTIYSGHYSTRAIAACAADGVGRAIEVRTRYFNIFAEKENENVATYNAAHKGGFGLENEAPDRWLLEAQATGEFFPGRPQIRPGLSLGDTGQKGEHPRISQELLQIEGPYAWDFYGAVLLSSPKTSRCFLSA